jgi:general secretion pathway protein L
MAGHLIVALPEVTTGPSTEAHWWLVADGEIGAEGVDSGWLALAGQNRTAPVIVGLAPSSAVRIVVDRTTREGSTPTQAAAVARLEALNAALGDPETLHAVSAIDGDRIVTAIVANASMLSWIDWARAGGAELDRIVPASLLMPRAEETWTSVAIGADHMLVRGDVVVPNEPQIAEAFVGGEPVDYGGVEAMTAALLRAAGPLPVDLRTGRCAKRRRFLLDRARVRELVVLALLIPLLTLAWAIVSIVKLNQSSDALDRETMTIAQKALGRPVPLENAEAELTQGRSSSRMSVLLAALYQALQAETAVSATQIGYSGGNFSVTLAAPSANEINRLLLALQRDGYRVTAVPRQSPDGRTMIDLTIRTGP